MSHILPVVQRLYIELSQGSSRGITKVCNTVTVLSTSRYQYSSPSKLKWWCYTEKAVYLRHQARFILKYYSLQTRRGHFVRYDHIFGHSTLSSTQSSGDCRLDGAIRFRISIPGNELDISNCLAASILCPCRKFTAPHSTSSVISDGNGNHIIQ
jgi:hypothetical protein